MSEFKLIEKTLGQILDHAVDRYSHKTAFVFTESELRLTWKELQEEVDTIAKGLIAIGIQKGEKNSRLVAQCPPLDYFLVRVRKNRRHSHHCQHELPQQRIIISAQAIRM